MTSDVRVHFLSYLDRLSRCEPSFLNAGCYQLFLRLPDARIVKVGALGHREFQSGIYIYSGSGRKKFVPENWTSSIRNEKKFLAYWLSHLWHWFFIFTYSALFFWTTGVFFFITSCANILTLKSLLPGLGSTDCKNGCDSHLLYLKSGEHLDLSDWQKFLQGNYPQLKFIQLSYREWFYKDIYPTQ